MPCYGNRIRAFACATLLLIGASAALAADISIRGQRIEPDDEGYTLSADFNINFNSRLEDAVNRGIMLYFVVDFDLTRARWYWVDEHIARRSKTYRLYYHALTRQYRVSMGALHQNYSSLDDALRVLSRLRAWPVLEFRDVKPGESYLASVQMRLDLSQMPKTFQVGALSNRDWNLSSDPLRWMFTPEPAAPKPPPIPEQLIAPPLPVVPIPSEGEAK